MRCVPKYQRLQYFVPQGFDKVFLCLQFWGFVIGKNPSKFCGISIYPEIQVNCLLKHMSNSYNSSQSHQKR